MEHRHAMIQRKIYSGQSGSAKQCRKLATETCELATPLPHVIALHSSSLFHGFAQTDRIYTFGHFTYRVCTMWFKPWRVFGTHFSNI